MIPEADRKVRLDQFDNAWFEPGGNSIKRLCWFIANVLFFKNGFNPISSFKVKLLRLFGAKVGNGVIIKPSVNIKYPWKLIIGNHVWIGEGVWIDNLASVTISDHVCISQGAMLLTGSHNYKKVSFDLIVKPIELDEGSWVGAQSLVCPGVHLNSHSILSAGSVATQDLEPFMIYQGNPATPKRKRQIGK